MSNSDLFRIDTGLEIDEASQYLTGAGAPGNTTSTNNAQRGSFYTNHSDGSLYAKVSSGTGTIRWAKIATEDYVTSYSATGISWREPVAVIDVTSATTAAILADLDADDLIQGVAVTVGMRILGANVTGNKNIFIVGGSTGAWTVTEDINVESVGDSTYVEGGTNASKTYQYNGTSWVNINAADATEFGYIHTFIGKSGYGSVPTVYNGINDVVVAGGQSLETAIANLDLEAGYQNVFTGKAVGSNLPVYSTNWFVTDDDTLQTAIGKLDTELGQNVTDGTVILAANKVNANITALDGEISSIISYLGKTAGVATPVYSSNVYISVGSATTTAIGELDAALAATTTLVFSGGITTVVDVDTVVGAMLVEWDVRAVLVSDSTKVVSMKILATQNGVVGDFTKFAVLKLGGGITGLVIKGVKSGSNLVLQVSSTSAVDVTARRVTSF